jgi:hypothetical protein
MSLQYSVSVRNARLDTVESTIGAAPVMELRSGDPPANCAAASSGTLLARDALPSDWMAAASSGSKAKSNTWTLNGLGTGVIGHFRIFEAGSPDVCHMQGTVGPIGSPTYDMTVDNVNIAASQVVTVSTFTLTAGNA